MNIITKAFGAVRRHGLQESLRRFGGYGRWTFDRHVRHSRYVIRDVHEYRMWVDLNDPGISTTLAKGILREKDQVAIVREELKKGDVVLDIGANIGYYALLEASLIGAEGHVFAFEPVPSNCELLGRNIALNGFESIIERKCGAVSDRTGETPFYMSAHSNLGSFFNKDLASGEAIGYIDNEPVMVPTEDIRSVLAGKKRLDFIRMDIEGAEVEVFRGLVDVVDKQGLKPKVLFETHRSRYHSETHDIEAPLRALFQRGYEVKTLASNDTHFRKWNRGYKARRLLKTDGTVRGLYSGIKNDDAIEFICRLGGVRAILLAPKT